jgi:hypothetical protein
VCKEDELDKINVIMPEFDFVAVNKNKNIEEVP